MTITTEPNLGTVLNPNNTLTTGLQHLIVGNSLNDYISGGALILNGSTVAGVTSNGSGATGPSTNGYTSLNFDSGVTAEHYVGITNSWHPGSNDFTVGLWCTFLREGSETDLFPFANWGIVSGVYEWALMGNAADSIFSGGGTSQVPGFTVWDSNGQYVVADTQKRTVGKPIFLIGIKSGTAIHFYRDGSLISSTACPQTINSDTLNRTPISLGGVPAITFYNTNADVYLAAAWNRALSGTEVASFCSDPWNMFAPSYAFSSLLTVPPTSVSAGALGLDIITTTSIGINGYGITSTAGNIIPKGGRSLPINVSLTFGPITLSAGSILVVNYVPPPPPIIATGGFVSPLLTSVSTGQLTIDKYTNLVTSEHADKPKFISTIVQTCRPFLDISNGILNFIKLYDVNFAIGEQLDVVGQWVGISRYLKTPMQGVYFSFDTPGVGWDQGIWQGQNDPIMAPYTLPDDMYRILILAKIANNFWDGSVEGAATITRSVFSPLGFEYIIQDNADMTMTIGLLSLLSSPTPVLIAMLTEHLLDIKPATVLVSDYFYTQSPGKAFAFDMNNAFFGGWESGQWVQTIQGY